MSAADPFDLIGQVLDGQFRVEKFVGEGGFSVVYKGHHVGLEEPIAIKCLKLPKVLGSALVDSFVKRFRDESRLHYRLSQGSLYIVRTLAHGTTMAPVTGALVPYMVLEWLDGRSLAADLTVRRARGDKGRSLEATVALLDSAVDGLAYAHAQQVVHRDMTPSNLFLTTTAKGVKLKVLDFGVAKVVSDQALALGPRAKTIGQIRIFAPPYAAPEQFDEKIGTVGTWSDVYSLALIALEVMSDRPAIQGEHLGDFAARAKDPDVRPTPRTLGIPIADEAEAVFASAVALDPKDRPQDAGQFWGSLKAAMQRDRAARNAAYAKQPAEAKPAEGKAPAPRPLGTKTVPMDRSLVTQLNSASPPFNRTLAMSPSTARSPSAAPPPAPAVSPSSPPRPRASSIPPAVSATPAPPRPRMSSAPPPPVQSTPPAEGRPELPQRELPSHTVRIANPFARQSRPPPPVSPYGANPVPAPGGSPYGPNPFPSSPPPGVSGRPSSSPSVVSTYGFPPPVSAMPGSAVPSTYPSQVPQTPPQAHSVQADLVQEPFRPRSPSASALDDFVKRYAEAPGTVQSFEPPSIPPEPRKFPAAALMLVASVTVVVLGAAAYLAWGP